MNNSSAMQGIRHSEHFPAFTDLPDYDDPYGPYYIEKSGMLLKTKHWCFMADIMEVSFDFVRPRVHVRTFAGEVLVAHFYHEREEAPTTFQWSDLKKGACIAIMYAYRKQMMDFTVGIRVEYLDAVFVFQGSLDMLRKENDKLLSDPQVCFERTCLNVNVAVTSNNDVTGKLLLCSRCKRSKFCCKEHQKSDWLSCHKKTCRQLSVLTQLMAIEGQPFVGHINFRFEVEQVTPQQQQEKADAARHDFFQRMGALPSSTACLVLPLQRFLSFMDSRQDWAEDVRGSLSTLFIDDLETSMTAPFLSSVLGRQLTESIERARIRCQNSITDLPPSVASDDSATVDHLRPRLPGNTMQLHLIESSLAHLPKWSIDAGCPIHWYLQVDFPSAYEEKYATPDWTILIRNSDNLVVRHSSGILACLCDQPGILAEYARLSKAQFPVLMLQPHINRAEETEEIVRKNATMPRLFTAWLRCDFPGSHYRYGPNAAPRYGPDDATKDESLPHIINALLDADRGFLASWLFNLTVPLWNI
mmetsp:Transcript_4965/g.7322  ORF Transcript_4965/g.7322 Transcript_4965/m.7322 type:complete len:529 (+) Transcript_4965:77-1663(+)